MSEALPQSRILSYIMIAGFLPAIYMLYAHNTAQTQLDRLEMRISSTQQSAYLNEKKQTANRKVQEHFKNTDRFYIDKHVESLSLMKGEIGKLKKIAENQSIATDPRITRRLEQLKKNSIQFSEGSVQGYSFFKEVPMNLTRPVEVDVDDIRAILTRIEGTAIGPHEPGQDRPQIMITDFKLDRKRGAQKSQIYSLTMKLIKREFF